MGNNQAMPKRQTKSQYAEKQQKREIIQNHIKEKNKESINVVQGAIDEQFKNGNISREEFINSSNTTNRIGELIDRGNKTFVKDDYIAIILKLNPEFLSKRTELQAKRNEDLIFIIRSIIYDANSIINTNTTSTIVNENISQSSHENVEPVTNKIVVNEENTTAIVVTNLTLNKKIDKNNLLMEL